MRRWSFRGKAANLAALGSVLALLGVAPTGGVYVTTLPAGADVWVDGTYLGHSPIVLAAVGAGDSHEDTAEVAEEDVAENLDGEEIECPLRGGARDVEFEDGVERDEEERQQQHGDGAEHADHEAQRGGLANVVTLGFAALETDGEVLVHERLERAIHSPKPPAP